MLAMKKLRALPDLSKLSHDEKDRLILKLYARAREELTKLDNLDFERSVERVERPFVAGEANRTPSLKRAPDSK
ncbi:hypothetical protein [Massilia glaciei]|uniref:Uncharacterized protein n=1 Tax=Massilia glaciei TaxID=1524097 RepID=A0A2U2HME9_9BURK|nr:hypothetical protein [Massilia glaciei]PWF48677.1 hypothetical protein C7C56_010585 [Massilia glaciei]